MLLYHSASSFASVSFGVSSAEGIQYLKWSFLRTEEIYLEVNLLKVQKEVLPTMSLCCRSHVSTVSGFFNWENSTYSLGLLESHLLSVTPDAFCSLCSSQHVSYSAPLLQVCYLWCFSLTAIFTRCSKTSTQLCVFDVTLGKSNIPSSHKLPSDSSCKARTNHRCSCALDA